ncbi:thiamine biosynthesis protein ApbE [Hyphomicrobium nitrativorans NL23]|uniref:FAD:protein FMN transferase n=1 Tax=Hyphomicrobium nitrativorans NL23 TaxID=1029756 RepID=V5SCV9_9HYPH|nr:FAD:protein FMN transferase [Hyphomicrobium nitrativorans]AHB48353.1 thiamine biosynthesis protein ApbE [Hyphomicrobium nitrativorans NL23]
MPNALSRRKVIALCAAAGGAALVPIGSHPRAGSEPLVEWTGVSLGSVSTIRLAHPDRRAGKALLRRAVAEARRLEAIFSLYREDTALSELNRTGVLIGPPSELVRLLHLCDEMWRTTGGAFDASVQPIWRCYADHFSVSNANAEGPPPHKLAEAIELTGWPDVRFSHDRIAFARRGMALTLNGIAQGYITDRVIEILRAEGITSSLVDMGEIRTMGNHPDGRAWKTAIDTDASHNITLDLVDKAVATTSADGFRFDTNGRCNHLFNPATGRCARPTTSRTVVAHAAAVADALSTALTFMDDDAARRALARVPGSRLVLDSSRG